MNARYPSLLLNVSMTLLIFFGINVRIHAQSYHELKLDSASRYLSQLPDTLLPIFYKIDSLRNGFNLAADTIHTKYQETIVKVDAETNQLNGTIDSLNRLQLPTERYTKRLDSLNSLRKTTESKFTSRLNALKAKTTDKLNALDLPPEFQEPLQELTKTVNDLRIDSDFIKIPELKIPGYTLPEFEGLGNLSSKTRDIGLTAGQTACLSSGSADVWEGP